MIAVEAVKRTYSVGSIKASGSLEILGSYIISGTREFRSKLLGGGGVGRA